MMKLTLRALPLTVGLLAAGLAIAGNVHLKQFKDPLFTDNGSTLTAAGALAGLGNGDIVVKLTAKGNPTATCTNPAGATQPPGQNPAEVTLTGVEYIPEDEIKNGTVSFRVSTQAPVSPIPNAPECPNTQWTERITDVAFTSASMTVEQPTGTTVLTVSCSFTTPTLNGAVPRGNVTCSVS